MNNEVLDNVHGRIQFTDGEKNVIDSPFMQRLRRVSQLTAVDVVFPGGTHNRFIHSLGVMKLSGDYMSQIWDNSECGINESIREYTIKLARMAGLLHDIGHGPFSHAFDRVVYSKIYGPDVNSHWPDGGHDIHRISIVSDPDMSQRIEASGVHVADLIAVWNAKPGDKTLDLGGIIFTIKTIVGGPLGADRMDFIMRDAYNTGKIHYGTIDAERIIKNASVKLTNGNDDVYFTLCYSAKVLSDVRHALDGRHYMYDEVYFHKKAMAASLVIEKMMENSCAALGLVAETADLSKFADLDEHSFVERARHVPESAEFARMHAHRILPDVVWSGMVPAGEEFEGYDSDSDSAVEYVQTRPITGIDPKKFDYYNIRFLEKDGTMVRCEEMLDRKSIVPIKPYCIVRGFRFRDSEIRDVASQSIPLKN